MLKEIVTTENAPKAIGPYSQAVKFENTLYLSGQIPLDPKTQLMVDGQIEAQTIQVFENLKAVCVASGADLSHILKVSIYLIDLSEFSKVNEIMSRYFQAPYPARICMEVKALPKGARIEIDAIMALTA